MSEVLEQVKQILEGSVDAAVVLGQDRRIMYYNRAYEALSGMRGRQLRQQIAAGAHCYEVFPLEICESQCIGCKSLEARRALRMDEIRAIRGRDGEEMTFIVTAVPVGDCIIETYRDVTADVRIQRRLKVLLESERRAKASLAEKVREATEELRQAQAVLVHQEKMSSLGRLVAGIAHELNNPINFVYGNVDFLGQYMEDLLSLVQLIDDAPLPPELRRRFNDMKEQIEYDFLVDDSRKLIRSIRSGAERTAEIVQDLKTFSRGGSGELQETDIAAGIETTLNLIAPLLKNRIEVRRNIASNLPKVFCNAGHINQVFMNILTNAAQAIDGEGIIDVDIDTMDDGRAIRVIITDSGPGILPDVMEKITDPFFTTKDVGEGTGLGLWITENIVRAHGGRLTWSSASSSGASFTVILPVHAPDTARLGITSGGQGQSLPAHVAAASAAANITGGNSDA
ncbi:sensor histidine kinase [Haliangium sp.]|uniref:sensor histidine kinase n=1 Tax=Haliangium sp. TaxID=2663208 RepID=UPI003D0B3BEF